MRTGRRIVDTFRNYVSSLNDCSRVRFPCNDVERMFSDSFWAIGYKHSDTYTPLDFKQSAAVAQRRGRQTALNRLAFTNHHVAKFGSVISLEEVNA
ncbi:hypothetical protein SAMN06265222_103369 [Neorhodopirellula lusitana]|uniref:Transposase n=1 Tax=Neorhodopirellula lusitana TaxID=445327 RepID=A0ABY1Q1R2_9BACT|nr:hypothetical protein SAMN06265222_103369 [Neorhodopirellula lusitana]